MSDDAPTSLPAGGDVVLLRAGEDELVPAVVRRPVEEGLVVVPLSASVDRATEWDLLLPEAPLGYRSMAQLWGFGSVLEEQVDEILGPLDDIQLAQLDRLAVAMRNGAEPPDDIPVGPQVLDERDPRLLAQDEESERLKPLWEPTLVLAGAATLGQLVAHRRSSLGLTGEQIAWGEVQEGALLEELEDDRLDIPSRIRPSELGALLLSLQIQASRRLGRIALWTIEAGAPEMARGASGPQTSTDAAGYVEEMLDRMRDGPQ